MSLGNYRQQIDEIDTQLLELFQKRMDTVELVAKYKIQHNLPVLHPEREEEILKMRSEQAEEKYKLYAKDFFSEIMKISRQMQKDIIAETKI